MKKLLSIIIVFSIHFLFLTEHLHGQEIPNKTASTLEDSVHIEFLKLKDCISLLKRDSIPLIYSDEKYKLLFSALCEFTDVPNRPKFDVQNPYGYTRKEMQMDSLFSLRLPASDLLLLHYNESNIAIGGKNPLSSFFLKNIHRSDSFGDKYLIIECEKFYTYIGEYSTGVISTFYFEKIE